MPSDLLNVRSMKTNLDESTSTSMVPGASSGGGRDISESSKNSTASSKKSSQSSSNNESSSHLDAGPGRGPTSNQQQQQPSSSGLPHPMMTNASGTPPNRPPSTTSVHSTGSASGGGPPRTTAMSRRGGRTRSRSPSGMSMSRPPSTTPSEGGGGGGGYEPSVVAGIGGSTGGSGSSTQSQATTSQQHQHPPMSPANPSAAAAAAAAAAKSFNRSGAGGLGQHHYRGASGGPPGGPPPPPSSSWYDVDGRHGGRYGAGLPPPPGVVGPPPGSIRRGGDNYGPPPPPHRRYAGGPHPPPLRPAPGYYDGGPTPPPHHPPPSRSSWPPPQQQTDDGRPPSRGGGPTGGPPPPAGVAGGRYPPTGSSSAPPPPGGDYYGYRGAPPPGENGQSASSASPYSYRGGRSVGRDPYSAHHRQRPGYDSCGGITTLNDDGTGNGGGEYGRRYYPSPYPPHPPVPAGRPSPYDASSSRRVGGMGVSGGGGNHTDSPHPPHPNPYGGGEYHPRRDPETSGANGIGRRPGSGRSDDPYYGAPTSRSGGGSRVDGGRNGNSGEPPSQDNTKSTRTVIGTATPIHVPRATDPSGSSSSTHHSERDARPSIFRGRPGSDVRPSSNTTSAANDGDTDDETNPQKILLALRTPSNSFEEKKSSRGSSDILSPQEPPQIQHSHHQSASDSNLFFDPQRSPNSDSPGSDGAGPPHPTNSLDMAPSFSLFNQSFDSLGDTAQFFNVGGPLDSALQSTSFGGAASLLDVDKSSGNEIQLSSSNGTFKLMGGPSTGNTFGMSPTNSFGNGVVSFSRTIGASGSNIQFLGGGINDHREGSPSQVLDIYRSNSAIASPRGSKPSLDNVGSSNSNLRLSGSMGSPAMGSGYNSRPFPGEVAPLVPHYQRQSHHHQAPQLHHAPQHRLNRSFSSGPTSDGSPPFYSFIRKHKEAFRNATFLLPGLKSALLGSTKKDDDEATPKRQTRDRRSGNEPTSLDVSISQRRVASAICAFGGTFLGSRINDAAHNPKLNGKADNQSIFREKGTDTATVTPTSSGASSETSTSGLAKVSRHRAKYDEALPGRYYENDNRLSWEFEEEPPVGHATKDDDDYYDSQGNKKSANGDDEDSDKDGGDPSKRGKSGDDDNDDGSGGDNEDGSTRNEDEKSDQPKMRYRCKLCGQPKQNHTCPYQQSLARSIGIMVYPAVNAFTSVEPGVLAPALSEMNNFIGSGDSVASADNSPSRPTPDRGSRIGHPGGMILTTTAQVTPESLRGASRGGSASPANTPQRIRASTPGSVASGRRSGPSGHYSPQSSSGSSLPKKRSHGQMLGGPGEDQADLLFVDASELKPEQFRMVTSSKILLHPDAFTYPSLPLPYAQRKRLSDNLFSLSKEVPQLTDECAAVLREARERDLWDLAVAELMTQVVVVVHCHDGDNSFDGLRRYLLTLGISC